MKLKTIAPRLRSLSGKVHPLNTAGGSNAAHYQTNAHRSWRQSVLQKDGYRCVQCGAIGSRLIADHIHEIVDGGDKLAVSNGQTLCQSCHARKTAKASQDRLQKRAEARTSQSSPARQGMGV